MLSKRSENQQEIHSLKKMKDPITRMQFWIIMRQIMIVLLQYLETCKT